MVVLRRIGEWKLYTNSVSCATDVTKESKSRNSLRRESMKKATFDDTSHFLQQEHKVSSDVKASDRA